MNARTGVLLVAYGGPDSLDDIEAFLADVRGGRPCSPEFVAEVRDRYKRIGGRSPLLDRTRDQAAALSALLEQTAPGRYDVRIGMRHWKPRIEPVVVEAVQQGWRRFIAIPLTPYGSRLSTGAYAERVREGLGAAGPLPEGARVQAVVLHSWHQQPGLLDAFEDLLRRALVDRTVTEGPEGTAVIFTAHSLPTSIMQTGDPYPRQLRETAEALARRLALPSWHLAYQSPGRTPQPWIGPFMEETMEQLAAQGWKDFVIVPIGFVCDHVEILYDIDVVLQEKAASLGVHMLRTVSPNAHPAFIRALESLVLEADGVLESQGLFEQEPLEAGQGPEAQEPP